MPKVIACQWNGRESNPRASDPLSDMLTISLSGDARGNYLTVDHSDIVPFSRRGNDTCRRPEHVQRALQAELHFTLALCTLHGLGSGHRSPAVLPCSGQ